MERAGAYAESRYRRGLRSWRRRALPPLAWRVVLATTVAVASAVWLGRGFGWFLAGAVFGGCVTVLAVVWELAPQAVLDWGRGAAGEQLTEKALAPSSPRAGERSTTYSSGAATSTTSSMGPRGNFCSRPSSRATRAAVEDGVLLTSPIDDPQKSRPLKVAAQLERHVRALRAGNVPGVKPVRSVQPVVVIWGDFPQRVCEGSGVFYVHGEELADWLRSRLAPPLEPFTELAER